MSFESLTEHLRELLLHLGASEEASRSTLERVEAARQSALSPVKLDLRAAPVPGSAAGGTPLELPDRYELLNLIGRGGMGEVYRVRDRRLGRTMALKLMSPELLGDERAEARFLEEAQATAQLQHPGVVPVHDMGRLGDGRYFFTMKEVTGRTLHAVIREVHAATIQGRWVPAPSGWTFRRVIDALQRVCEAVAYAHARGVVHRDLKPSNILVGDYGEVIVVDWGLARVQGQIDHALAEGDLSPEDSPARVGGHPLVGRHTRRGRVSGTPAYMSPEQAAGDLHRMGPATDIYAIGAILYEALAGHPPYLGSDARQVLQQVRQGAAPPPSRDICLVITRSDPETDPDSSPRDPAPAEALEAGELIPEPLRHLCQWAMAREPEHRPASVQELAREIGAWLDGARRREAGLAVVERAQALLPRMAELAAHAAELESDAARRIDAIHGWRPVADKEPAWAIEDSAQACRQELDVAEVRYLQLLRGALTHDPELPEAHALLAAYYHRRHRQAESSLDDRAAAHHELLLRSHDRAGVHAGYLSGEGSLTLVTDPPGAQVTLYRFEAHRRYLRHRFVRRLTPTPIVDEPLPMGSYLLVICAPGRASVRYPVSVAREGRWDGARPGGDLPFSVVLPELGEVASEEVYVPAGWFWSGGDAQLQGALPRRRIWVDAFYIQRFPVTHRQYLVFLNDLVAQGRDSAALRFAPRDRGGAEGGNGAFIYGRQADGSFELRVDDSGVAWSEDWPVVMIDWSSANAYAAWYARRADKAAWRLPFELEWEKAARGVDGRVFPWGSHLDPTFACVQTSHRGPPSPPDVKSYPLDKSVYGVRGLAGNVGDWCLDPFLKDGPPVTAEGLFEADLSLVRGPYPLRVYRGGSWIGPQRYARAAFRYGYAPESRYANLGFRLVRSATQRAGVDP